MSKIFIVSEFNNKSSFILNTIEEFSLNGILCQNSEDGILVQIEEENPEIILIDTNYKNSEILTKQIKSQTAQKNTQIILILDNNSQIDFLNFAHGYLTRPFDKNILINTINSHIKTKKSLEQMEENNRELARSLYQLNVLYNTSSQFAGTLDKKKLYNIMLEAMEKTLSFDISCLLVFSSQGTKFFINSLNEPTESLKEALTLRTTLGYKNIFKNKNLPHIADLENIEVTQSVKPSHRHNIYDLRALNFDSLFAPIKVDDNFFGVIELFRETPFTKEDVTCFQTIVHQVATPLRSATLYEEIKDTNVKLEKLERLKSDFISIVSHELRTPLTPINNSLEIVLSEQTGTLSDDAKNFINMAKRNVSRLSGIIEDLLDLSRIETGKLDFKYKKVDITPSLELIQKTFEQTAQEKNVEVNLSIENNLEEIYADTHRLEQVLSNLITNALKFTQQNGKINIIAKTIDEKEINQDLLVNPILSPQGKYIQISTIDTGIGIKKEDINKIFEKFSQIENSLNRNIGGIGLGLPITKQLIDAHLGLIWVESEENKGSNFSFLIPLYDDKKAFIMNLSKNLTTNSNVSVFKITQKENCDFIKYIKENNILKLTKNSYEIDFKTNETENYIATFCMLEKSAIDFMEKAINCELKKPQWQNCDIVLKRIDCEQESKDLKKILKKLSIE